MSVVAVLALASCSSDSMVTEVPTNTETPIAFTVSQRNSTRAASNKLEDNGYKDFGVWAYKTKTGSFDVVMNNYKVEHRDASDNTAAGWFYEGVNGQILRYWDLSYTNTNFYAYAPYEGSGVTFDESTKTITVPASVNKAGTEHDVIYAGKQMTNSEHANVPLQFKHLGAKVNLQFYEDIPGYSVELLEVTSGKNDIIATPKKLDGTDYKDALYFTQSEATIVYDDNMSATPTVKNDGTPDSNTPLSFNITEKSSDSKVVPQAVSTGDQGYLKSPTTYYAVGQPKESETGFLFQISYKLTAEDSSKEEIIVNNAQVFVPASKTEGGNTTYIAAWQPNTAYTYTFKITVDNKLYPIVFDNITIEDYTAVSSESNI